MKNIINKTSLTIIGVSILISIVSFTIYQSMLVQEEKQLIVGTWIVENEINNKWIFRTSNECMWELDGTIGSTFNYNIVSGFSESGLEQTTLILTTINSDVSEVGEIIEYGIVGSLKPGLSHLINIILYGLTGLLLFRVLNMMFRKRKPSVWWLSIPFLTSLLFIAHPIHSEAVANIKGRDEIMALLLSLATLYAVLRYMDHKKVFWLVSSCVLFFRQQTCPNAWCEQ